MYTTRSVSVPSLLRCVAATAACVLGAASVSAAPLTVTLLGTGTPAPNPNRFGQSILVQAADQNLLFDLGRGVTIRLNQIGIPFRKVDASFITHMHSDHINGLADLWMTGWVPTGYGSRTTPMVVYGPKGTVSMTEHLSKAYAENTRIRHADEKVPLSGIEFDAHDIDAGPADAYQPTLVYEKSGVRVLAFNSHHGDLIEPNFGYIVEFDGKKFVLSGDTTYDERVARAAEGSDVLVHEVAYFDPALFKNYPNYREIQAHHTTPQDAGRIFSRAKPKLAVYSHIIVRLAGKSLDNSTDILVEGTRETYDGPLAMGKDLMRFVIDQGKVTVIDDARAAAKAVKEG
ncbi:MAG: MBL fold metallo-hydrolase [Castellaniella sp.]|uniref:MBL fold metallo-hydrolase n=1 Tax=Castellaniella sp. TaxID=1955812 RepID=UPI003A88B8CA